MSKNKSKKTIENEKKYEKNEKKIEESGLVFLKKNTYLCLYCGNIIKTRRKLLVKNPICRNCMMGQSFGENKVIEILKRFGIQYEKEKTFGGLKGVGSGNLRFDFYITGEKRKFIIEIDGEQHSQETIWSLNTKAHDNIKNQFCIDRNIKLYRIIYRFGKLEKLEKEIMKVLESEFSEFTIRKCSENTIKDRIMTDDEVSNVIEKLKSSIPKDLKQLKTINSGMEVTVKLPSWLAKKNKHKTIISGIIISVTEKAILLKNEQEFWLPKSQVKIYKNIHLKQNDNKNSNS